MDLYRTIRAATLAFAVTLAGLAGYGATARPAAAQDPSFVTFSLGYFDVLDNNDGAAVAGGLEWMSNKRLWIFQPIVGAMVTSEGSLYGYAGLATDFFFGNRWVLTPSFAVGAYSEGDGVDLGHVLEFRSSIALSYRFDDRSRLGLRFYHLSNADIGDENPGVEVLDLTYSIPLR